MLAATKGMNHRLGSKLNRVSSCGLISWNCHWTMFRSLGSDLRSIMNRVQLIRDLNHVGETCPKNQVKQTTACSVCIDFNLQQHRAVSVQQHAFLVKISQYTVYKRFYESLVSHF